MLSNLVVIYDHSQKSSRPLFGASFQRYSRRRKGEVKVSIERLSHKSPWTPLLASQVVMAVELQQAKVGAFGRRLRPVPVNLPWEEHRRPLSHSAAGIMGKFDSMSICGKYCFETAGRS